MSGPFSIRITGPTAHPVIVVRGDVELTDCDEVLAVATGLRLSGRHKLIFDVHAVTFADSSWLSIFTDLLQHKMLITIRGASDQMVRLFDMSGLMPMLNFEPIEGH